jgi:hypothetical protein
LIYGQEKLGVGIGILPTGSETGISFRTSKQNRFLVDLRISKANIFFHPNAGSVVNEVSFLYRVSMHEKLRFHIGLGARSEWTFDKKLHNRHGIISTFGVEAFPFPFQNGGLFFEIAPYYTADKTHLQNLGIRSSSGFIYYVTKKQKKHEKI